uniref:homing endonuclease n=1 Tax=Leptographium procerum TaxID=100367 RepID=UPI0023F2A39F|nr:homing endonuclease [Leptographium procerum]WDW21000.1 homing endonuclease [Leptographium procerum]WDZ67182.1 homing endonuclease [Leptographium procerum]
MKEFYTDKKNHPMFGKNHTKEALSLISKPGELNPMFGRKHSEEAKKNIALKQSKYENGVGIFDLEDNLLYKFINNVELAKHLNISKVTVGKYLNNNLVYKNKFKFKPIA